MCPTRIVEGVTPVLSRSAALYRRKGHEFTNGSAPRYIPARWAGTLGDTARAAPRAILIETILRALTLPFQSLRDSGRAPSSDVQVRPLPGYGTSFLYFRAQQADHRLPFVFIRDSIDGLVRIAFHVEEFKRLARTILQQLEILLSHGLLRESEKIGLSLIHI